MRHLSKSIRILLFTIFVSPLLLTACGAKKMSGTFVGEATAKLKPVNSSSDIVSDVSTDTSRDALATLTQDGDEVTILFSNTTLLKNCELKAKITKNSGIITSGAICEADIAGTSRNITVWNGEVYVGDYGDHKIIITVFGNSGGSSEGDSFNLRFEGNPAK